MSNAAIKLEIAEDGRTVYANVSAELANGLISELDILDAISENGYSSYFIFKDEIDRLSRINYANMEGTISRPVAEKRDAEIIVDISSDGMRAWLTVMPAYGGEPLTRDSIIDAVEEGTVTFGIMTDVIEQAVKKGALDKTLFAKGVQPKRGKNTKFEYLVQEVDENQSPQVLEDGSVDFRELNIVTTVEPNEPLMRKIPATKGIPGMTVTGIELSCIDGEDKPLGENVGSEIDEKDPHLLVAKVAGKPIRGRNYVKVVEIFTVGNVGVETGNIRFGGSVVINGSVGSGFEVRAGGDIDILGSVEASLLEAGGNIRIQGGVLGNSGATLVAVGNIQAKFIDSAVIVCDKNLIVQEYLSHSESRVAGEVLVGVDSGKGQINGGEVFASKLIKAKVLGSQSSTTTSVNVGANPYFKEKLKKIENDLSQKKKDLEEAIKSIIYIRTKSQERKDELPSLEEKRSNLLYTINTLTEEIDHLRDLLSSNLAECKIVGTDTVFAGVKLSFLNHRKPIMEDFPGSSFTIKTDKKGHQEIKLGPIMDYDFDWNYKDL